MPKTPFPEPESYAKSKAGEAPRAGETGRGMENEAVPLTAFTENFSSMPFMAPPPFGRVMEGDSIALDFDLPLSVFRNREEGFWFSVSLSISLFFLIIRWNENFWELAIIRDIENGIGRLQNWSHGFYWESEDAIDSKLRPKRHLR